MKEYQHEHADVKIAIIDSDDIAHDIMKPGSSPYKKVTRFFESYIDRDTKSKVNIMSDDGITIDRAKLSAAVFKGNLSHGIQL